MKIKRQKLKSNSKSEILISKPELKSKIKGQKSK